MLRLQMPIGPLSLPQTFAHRSRPLLQVTARCAEVDAVLSATQSQPEASVSGDAALGSKQGLKGPDRPTQRMGIDPDEFERLRNLGIPVKPTFIPQEETSNSYISSEPSTSDTQNSLDSVKPLPRRVTPSMIARQKAKAQAQILSNSSKILLSESRRRKQLERLAQPNDKDLAVAAEKEAPPTKQAFWRKKKDTDGLSDRQLTSRIGELKRRRQLNQVVSLLEEAKSKGKKLNTITMNAAVAACVHCGDIERALDMYDEMSAPSSVCKPDNITYGCLLKGLGNARRLDDAFELLECMEAGTAPGRPGLNEIHLNTLVNACADAGDARRARGVLQRFRAYGRGLGPSTLTYNLLIKGYARSDNPLEALKVVDEMQLQGMALERVSYNSLLLACIRGGDLETALDLIHEMKGEAWRKRDASLWPDTVSYTTVLKGLAEDGDLEGVLSLTREMKEGAGALEHTRTGEVDKDRFIDQVNMSCQMDRVAYGVVIDACLAVGSTQDALSFLGDMESQAQSDPSMRPRAHVFLSLMRALAKKGELQKTQALRERLSTGEVAGRVWAEDLWQADELILEAAMGSGKVEEAERNFMSMFARAPGGKPPSFSDRGMEAVVRLSFSSQLPTQELEPVALRPEVGVRQAVEVVMQNTREALTLPVGCRREDLEAALGTGASCIPVLSTTTECVGVLTQEDLQRWGDISEEGSGSLATTALLPPPTISRYATVGDAASLMLAKGVEVLAVVQGDIRHQAGLVRQSSKLGDSAVVGFLFHNALF